MSQAKYAAVKELIQEKKYSAARAVLETIDDPQASQWLAKLDRIAAAEKPVTKQSGKRLIPWIITVIVTICAVIGWGIVLTGKSTSIPFINTKSETLQRYFDAYCAAWGGNDDLCNPAQPPNLAENERVQRCYVASGEGENIESFKQCMLVSGIKVPTMQPPRSTPPLLSTVTPRPK